jgi:hypothetical protein
MPVWVNVPSNMTPSEVDPPPPQADNTTDIPVSAETTRERINTSIYPIIKRMYVISGAK